MRYTLCIALLFLIQLPVSAQVKADVAIIPAPLKLEMQKGSFVFSKSTVIQTDVLDNKITNFLTGYLQRNRGVKNPVLSGKVIAKGKQVFIITDKGTEKLTGESYRLTITPNQIKLAGKGAGLFYGLQTLIQLFPNAKGGTAVLPCVIIEDSPRYAYRGLMLDVSRHFFTVKQVKQLLDLMAAYKLNRFHWHLTDDQGWRIEIKSYPKLTGVGAWRVPRLGDFGSAIDPPQPGEAATDGGFYTQAEIKDVVQYAAERQIQIVPEIDVPGHCMAAIAAYPGLSVTKNPDAKVNPGNSFAKWFPGGGFEMYVDNTLNPTDENVYQFLDKVFGEVARLFPYPCIHIGGDECFKGYWEKDGQIKEFMQKMNIKTTHDLQMYFTARVNRIIVSKNKKMIGWDEIMNDSLNSSTIIMNRFGEKSAIAQTKKGLDIILAPGGNGLYFDYAQSASDMEPGSHGGFAPVWKAYDYNPAYQSIDKAGQQHILGIEGCVWTEHISSTSKLYYMILPRMLALAETGWTAAANKNYSRFANETLPLHLDKFEKAGYNYHVPTAFNYTDTTLTGNKFLFDLKPPVPGAKIFYTLDNRPPGDADQEYKAPLKFTLPDGKKIILKTIVITPTGRRSVITRTTMYNGILPKTVSDK